MLDGKVDTEAFLQQPVEDNKIDNKSQPAEVRLSIIHHYFTCLDVPCLLSHLLYERTRPGCG